MTGIASQPFWLSWTGPDGKDVAHAPDFFVRRADGSAVVVDCRPAERRPARDLAKFEATRRAGVRAGRLGVPAGWRAGPDRDGELAVAGRVPASAPWPARADGSAAGGVRRADLLMAGAEAVGDPIAVLPVLFHLLCRHELVTDLSVPLHPCAAVTTAA